MHQGKKFDMAHPCADDSQIADNVGYSSTSKHRFNCQQLIGVPLMQQYYTVCCRAWPIAESHLFRKACRQASESKIDMVPLISTNLIRGSLLKALPIHSGFLTAVLPSEFWALWQGAWTWHDFSGQSDHCTESCNFFGVDSFLQGMK